MKTVDERTGEKVEKTVFSINTSEDFARLRQLWSKMPMIPKVTPVEDARSVFRLPGSPQRHPRVQESRHQRVQIPYLELAGRARADVRSRPAYGGAGCEGR